MCCEGAAKVRREAAATPYLEGSAGMHAQFICYFLVQMVHSGDIWVI